MRTSRLVAVFAAAALLAGCSSVDSSPDDDGTVVDDTTLRGAAERHGLAIGVAVGTGLQRTDGRFADVLRREFNILVAENAMKPAPLRPDQQTFSFSESDQLVEFAESNAMQVRGHTLVWHQSTPSWMESPWWSRAQLLAILENHISTVVARYKGRVLAWDVVNEAIADGTGALRETMWLQRIGPEYLEWAFRWAHNADPDAKLFYNEYGAEALGRKSDAQYNLVRDLIDAGVPIHGVGFQMHVSAESPPRMDDVAVNMARLAGLGLEVHITELDVRIPIPATQSGLVQQAVVYRDILDVCLEAPNCTGILTWGLTDRHSWVPSFFDGYGDALLFDEEYQPKLAWQVMLDGLREAAQ